jgi:hypothetical protein
MRDRAEIAAGAAGSLRLEGLKPSAAALEVAERWAHHEVSDAELREAERRLLSERSQMAAGGVAASPAA